MPHIRMEKVFERERKGKEGGRAGATRERGEGRGALLHSLSLARLLPLKKRRL